MKPKGFIHVSAAKCTAFCETFITEWISNFPCPLYKIPSIYSTFFEIKHDKIITKIIIIYLYTNCCYLCTACIVSKYKDTAIHKTIHWNFSAVPSSMSFFELHCAPFHIVPRDNRILIGKTYITSEEREYLGFRYVCTKTHKICIQTWSKKIWNMH
jgi:hypothetical protein